MSGKSITKNNRPIIEKVNKIKISADKAQIRAAELRAILNRANHEYYVMSAPSLSDHEYDELFRELMALEEQFPDIRTNDSPTLRVGTPPSSQFDEVIHPIPMLSLSNATDEDTFSAWYQRALNYLEIDTAPMVCELKIDGLAIAVTYRDGILAQAATRGNGIQGEDVTANVRTIKSVPLKLTGDDIPALIEIRGEVYYPISAFNRLNQEREARGLPQYVNPRNSASGSLRQLDSSETAKRPLNIFFYSIGYAEGGELPPTQWERLEAMQRWGCRVNNWTRRTPTPESAIQAFEDAANARSDLDFGIDGVVVKFDDIESQDRLGSVGRDPRWATAYKFPAEQAVTTLIDIRTHVGRTGAINPYAVLDPIMVGGVNVGRATLHNQEDINRKDIRAGDKVIVQRAGDVIPQIVGPAPDNKRSSDSEPYQIPPECPACGEPVSRSEDQADIRCVNSICPAQFERLLEHFASRSAMDIEGMGTKMAQELARSKLVTRISDIYTLHERKDQLLAMERMAEKRAQNLLQGIENSKSQPLSRLLFGLGIIGVGAEMAETLSNHFRTLEKIIHADTEQLTAIEGVGPIVAQSIRTWAQNEANIQLAEELLQLGVNTIDDSPEPLSDHPIKGMTFVITGKLDNFSRAEAANAVKSLGAKASSSVSKNTDFVVAGADAGSKLERALKLNIHVLDEDQFKQVLDGNLPEKHAEPSEIDTPTLV